MSDTIVTLKTTAWEFPNSFESSVFLANNTWQINFTTSVGNYTALSEGWDTAENRGVISYNSTSVYQGDAWLVAAQRSIVITGGVDVEDADLILWLTTNATQQDPQQALVYLDQLNADLRTVADSIRAKTGDQSTLSFPDEFVDAIASITTGGMVNPMENQGDLIVGGTGGTPTRLAQGSNGQVLSTGASGPEWTSINDVYYCTYGVTTYAEITAALAAGKLPVCLYEDRLYVFTIKYSDTYAYAFFTIRFNIVARVVVSTSDVWQADSNNFEITSNKVTSISTSSTDTQYPSAKCVYDAVQGATELFWCTYGTTTYAEITAALAAGKLPVCMYSYRCYTYAVTYSDGYGFFAIRYNNSIGRIFVGTSNVWKLTYADLEVADNKVTSISASSTDTQYPSAKCVYDNLLLKQDALPSGTNGYLLAAGSGGPSYTNNLPVLTTAPTANNTDGGVKIVVLPTDPVTKYTGYMYIILDTTPVSYSQSGNVLTVVDAPLVQDDETVTTL